MEIYEKPQVEVLTFLAREPIAAGNVTLPAVVDDNLSMEPAPTFNEGIEDW